MDQSKVLKICKKCGSKCCKIGGPDCTKKEVRKILRNGFKNYFFEASQGVYETKIKKGNCPYLKKDGSCGIEKVKPKICKCWPVFPKIENNKRRYILFECPLTKLLSDKEILKLKKFSKKIPKKVVKTCWNSSTFPKDQLNIIMKKFSKFKSKKLK